MAATSGAQALHDNVAGLFDAIRSRAGVDGAMTFAQAAQAVASIPGGADVVALDMSGGALGQAEGLSEVGAGVYAAPAPFTLGVPQPPASMEGATFAGWLVEGAAEGATAGGSPLTDGLLPASGPVEFSGLSDGAARLTAVWVSLSAPGKVYDGEPAEAVADSAPRGLLECEVSYWPDGGRTRLASAPVHAGSYKARADWSLGAAIVSREAAFSVSKRPFAASLGLYLGGEPFPDGGSVRYGSEEPEWRVDLEGVAPADDPRLGFGEQPRQWLHLRVDTHSGEGSGTLRRAARLQLLDASLSDDHYLVRDLSADPPEARGSGTVAEASYALSPKPVGDDTVRAAPHPVEGRELFDGEAGGWVPSGYLSRTYRSAEPAPAGSAGSVEYGGACYTAGGPVGDGGERPGSEGVYIVELEGRVAYAGTRLLAFGQGAADVSGMARLEYDEALFDGLPHEPAVSVEAGGVTYGEGVGYVSYRSLSQGGEPIGGQSGLEPGAYWAEVRGVGPLRGSASLPYRVLARPLGDPSVTASATAVSGDDPRAPQFSLSVANASGAYELVRGADYTVAGYSLEGGEGAGYAPLYQLDLSGATALYAKLAASSSGRFSGSRVVEVPFTPASEPELLDISEPPFEVRVLDDETAEPAESVDGAYPVPTYEDGAAPWISVVRLDGEGEVAEELFEDVDFEVDYNESDEWQVGGEYTVTVTGIPRSGYTGTVEVRCRAVEGEGGE